MAAKRKKANPSPKVDIVPSAIEFEACLRVDAFKLQTQLDRSNEANGEALNKEVADFAEKVKPVELVPVLEGEIAGFKVEAQELGSKVDSLESVVASGEEEVKKNNEERDKSRLFGQPSTKEALAAGSFSKALNQVGVVDRQNVVPEGKILKLVVDGAGDPEVIYP